MSDFIGDWHALLVLVIAGFLPNEVWRMLGLWLGGGVDEGSELLVWVRAVATAILAGVIAQILVLPPGALASVPDWLRYGAVAAGFAVFMLTRRSIFAGVVVRRGGDAGWQMVAGLILFRELKRMRGNGMNSRARSALAGCLALVAALAATPNASAAEYPTRPIKLVVPYAAGGPTDVLGRLVGEYLGRDLKQAVIVENKAGAQGAIGAEAVARAEPDGYTLFVTAASIIVLNPMLYKKLPYDPVQDFRMLALVTDLPVVMEVHPSVPAKTVAEFVAYAKQNPGKLNFGSAGTGGTIHLAGEMFKQIAGVDMVHVALQGRGPGADRSAVGQYPGDVRHAEHGVAAGERRIVAAAGRQFGRSEAPICRTCRPSPRAAIPITASASGLASQHPPSCRTMSRRRSAPASTAP